MKPALCLLIFWGCAPAAKQVPRDASSKVLFAESSQYGEVFVVEEGDLRILRFDEPDGDDQTVVSRSEPQTVPMDYVRAASVSLAFVQKVDRVGMIGLGGGAFSSLVHRAFKEAVIDVAEINPVVVDVARRYFGVREDERYRITVADGLAFIETSTVPFSLLFLDAYTGGDIPEHLATEPFFQLARKRAEVVVINLSLEPKLEAEIVRRFTRVFPSAVCFDTLDGQNRIVVGTHQPPGVRKLFSRAQRITRVHALPFNLAAIAKRAQYDCPSRVLE